MERKNIKELFEGFEGEYESVDLEEPYEPIPHTNYDVLKQLGLTLQPSELVTLFSGADIICYGPQPEEGRCHRHDGLCEQCVAAWLNEEASEKMLQFLNKGE